MIGEEHGNGGGPTNTGAAYVFRYDGTSWPEEQKLTASDGAGNDRFGETITVDGDVIVIGAEQNGVGGAAYVFCYDGTAWTETQKLVSSDIAAGDDFGASVSMNGDVLVVGADYDDDGGSTSGSAYVFRNDGTMWTEEAKLTANDAAANNFFGHSVSVGKDKIVVGAHANNNWLGAAYVFRYDGSNWRLEQKLVEFDGVGDDFDYLGWSVAATEDVIVVGSWADDTLGSAAGAVHVYSFTEPLAGNPLGAYPHFEFVRAINAGQNVSFALDPDVASRGGRRDGGHLCRRRSQARRMAGRSDADRCSGQSANGDLFGNRRAIEHLCP